MVKTTIFLVPLHSFFIIPFPDPKTSPTLPLQLPALSPSLDKDSDKAELELVTDMELHQEVKPNTKVKHHLVHNPLPPQEEVIIKVSTGF